MTIENTFVVALVIANAIIWSWAVMEIL
ncbi:uncharacterized protein METZ01_LOCUS233065 [marine metagenome]|uniref:Uncharacterized protein n=1 Tax=marine metagenome TaxID=408172 RepID=A0A382H195_9ZZZZ